MKNKIIPYNPKLKERARELRKNSTFSEIMLWQHLRKKQILGFDFDRQKPLDNFIVDFYCKELILAIEIDGESHHGNEEYDNYRDRKLNELGIEEMRFDEMLVIHKMDRVFNDIEEKVRQLAAPKE